ncbi:MAG: UDP-N-acetylmuramoyl-tripeptide--D-alanyl-D-alanine ligase [Candidatus Hydrogenedentes bacterium]|nr:UDP-N-acetylmuramoyl-tripeptide--D-alanyl-D-alanine ligase [Candidatus Hydrogenedentota bacterium]
MGWTYTVEELAHAVGSHAAGNATPFSRVSTDTRTIQPGDVFFALKGEKFDANAFVRDAFSKGACAVVATQPNAAGVCLVVPDTQAALQSFAGFHRARYSPIVFAITGSCGKTTSKDMIAAVLATRLRIVKTQGNLNNEIGCPLSLLQIDGNTQAAIIEMGAAKRGNIAELCAFTKPGESAITLIAPAHLEGFGSIENIADTKGEIAEALPPEGIFYVNTGNEWCARVAERVACRKILYGHRGDVVLKSYHMEDDGEAVLDIEPVGKLRLPLPSREHASNVLLAIAVGLQHGITEFEGPLRAVCADPARFKKLRIGALDVIDDTYNASPASMAAALRGLAERPRGGARIAALGDMLELGPTSDQLHAQIGTLTGTLGLAHVFALGERASAMISAARDAGVPHAEVLPDHAAVARAILDVARPDDVLLVKGSRGMRMERVIEQLKFLSG